MKEVTNDGTVEQVDIISGGFPCQDVSLAGKRAGLAGKRTGLWFEYQRIIDEFRPRWIVIENVPGLLSSWAGDKPPSDLQEGEEWKVEQKSDFFHIIKELDKRGYCVSWRILDAQYFGVAQRRRRVFIVGSLGNTDSAKVLFESENLLRNSKKIKKEGKEVTGTFTIRSGCEGGGKGYLGREEGAMTLGGQPQYLYNIPLGVVRNLTPTENERLQGFPDGWTNNQADTHRYKQLKNAVCVKIAEWIGKRIVEIEDC